MHPLNLAIAFQILDNIKNGQLRSCMAMGFEEKDLQILIDPRSMGTLVNSPVPWFKVVVDGTIVHRLLVHASNTAIAAVPGLRERARVRKDRTGLTEHRRQRLPLARAGIGFAQFPRGPVTRTG